jgi:hypothetical protein
MLESGLGNVIRRGQREDGPLVLVGQHPAGGEGATLPDPFDPVPDRSADLARPQEGRLQAVRDVVLLDRPVGSRYGLRGNLSPEHPLQRTVGLPSHERVRPVLGEFQEFEQLVNARRHGRPPANPVGVRGSRRCGGRGP